MKKSSITATLSLLMTIILVLAGCATSPTPTPVQKRVSTPTVRAPKATLEPTSTPLPPQPPLLLSRSPERGEELPADAPLVLRFDQEMDAASVEKAFHIEPDIAGSFTWDDARTLSFTPDKAGFARNETYRVTIDKSAQSAKRLGLLRPIEFRFHTVGFLEIADVFPMPDSADVSTESTIRVIFNRPVVPLTAVQAQKHLLDPLEFSPAIKGRGTWTNTSIYSFEPEKRLLPGTEYTVRVSAGLEDTTGGILEEDYVWSFTTELPDVLNVSPKNKSRYVSPMTTVTITFNQPMDHQATQARLILSSGKDARAVRGTFTWQDNALTFTPSHPLDRGVLYDLRLEKGAPAATGVASVAKTYDWQFETASLPVVTSIHPLHGEEEVPLNMTLNITFSSPISRETFVEGLTITPEAYLYSYWRENDTVVNVGVNLKPSTVYTVALSQDIVGRYGAQLAKAKTISFRTRPYDPSIRLNVPGSVGTYNAYAEPTVYVNACNTSRVDFALYKLPIRDFIAFNREGGWRKWDKYESAESNLERRWSLSADAPLNASRAISTTLTKVDGTPLDSGFYYLSVSAPAVRRPQRHLLVISPMNLTLKSTPTDALIWATDLKDGLPIPDTKLSIYNDKGLLVAETTTDGNGVAMAEFPEQDPWATLIVLARDGDQVGAVLRYWSNGIAPWEFQLNAAPVQEQYRAYFYTERRIYRPGQKVYFKGILRVDDDARYSLPPANSPIEVTVRDSQGREFWNETLITNDMGTIDGEIELSENAPLGYYHIEAVYQEQFFGTDFQVAEYRKPEFQVEVSLDKDDYVHGDTIQATAEASYFFGGPVSKASVTWRVMRNPFFFNRWQGKGYYSFNDYEYRDFYPHFGSHGEFVTEGTGETDAQGRFTFTIPADISEYVQSQAYTIEASVIDLNNQEVSARSAAVIHKGTFYIGLAAKRYVGTVGQELPVHVITVDTQGITRTQQTLDLIFYRHEWYSVKEKTEDGYYYWTNKVKDTPIVTKTVTTDDLGQVTVSFVPPEGGTYKVLAKGLDERENAVRSALYLWVSGRGFINWGQRNNDRIELIADKKSYRPGETAHILIPSPYQGPTKALLTIERGGILDYEILEIESNSEQLSIPILPAYAPNVYVSIVLIKGMTNDDPMPGFKVGYVMLPVSTEQKELQISITPDQSTPYKPRDKVVYEIEALNYRGEGVVAEISLQLVDLAVESIGGSPTTNIVPTFYGERGLGLSTATTLALSVDRRNLEYSPEGKGGGGGGPGEGIIREAFPDTAFWAPTIRTDASGRARVTVELPDNLTTWRLTAQAVTAHTEVGTAHADIVSNLDVMIRPMAPRFMVIGDEPILGAVVHNNTSQTLEMTVNLDANGVTVSQSTQTLSVPASDRAVVSWHTVVGAAEEATLTFKAEGGRYSDAVALRLPVYHPSSPEIVGTAGVVEDQIVELVRLPEEVDTSLGELTVQLEPSLAASMRGGLKYLKTYPYDCIEQTVSRFLPNVVTYRALRELGVANPELSAQLPQQVALAVQKLYALQSLDGGWGWWPNEKSSPTITAYALLGLTEAQRAGFIIDQQAIDLSTAYLYKWLGEEFEESRRLQDTRAMVLYALAEAGQGDLGRTVVLYDNRSNMSLYSKGFLAMALHLLDPKETMRTDALINEITEAAILSATGAHWEEEYRSPWAMNTDTRTTAIVLRTLVRLKPNHSLLPNAVRWLTTVRNNGRWETTQENTWAILALTDYMVTTGELEADYSYDLLINDEEHASGEVTPDTVEQVVRSEVPVSALRQEDTNVITISRTDGTGMLYYSAFLRYYLPADKMRALNRGIIVDRQYYLADDPEKPVDHAAVNDILIVKLTMIAPNDLHFLVLEDPLPAGCEAIDRSLKTSRSITTQPAFAQVDQPEGPYDWWWRRYWPSHTELRDEKTALFATYLPKGTYEYTYQLRCSTAGEFKVLPTTAYEMYFADIFGRSAGSVFTIKVND